MAIKKNVEVKKEEKEKEEVKKVELKEKLDPSIPENKQRWLR